MGYLTSTGSIGRQMKKTNVEYNAKAVGERKRMFID